jgi:hypothetical protein
VVKKNGVLRFIHTMRFRADIVYSFLEKYLNKAFVKAKKNIVIF